MMMEQQMILKSDEMQKKWNTCVIHTCYAYRMVEHLTEAIEVLTELIRNILNNIVDIFKPFVESFQLVFNRFKDFLEDLEDYYVMEYKVYSRKSFHIKKVVVNTKGFPRPIIFCARSRC